MHRFIVTFLVIWIGVVPIQAQILKDAEVQQWIHYGLDKMYNLEFKESSVVFEQIRQRYPTHPVYPMLKSMEVVWQNLPLGKNLQVIQLQRSYLNEVVKRADEMLKKNKNDVEGIFFNMSAHGFLALSFAESDEMMAAVGEARKTYVYLKDGMKMLNSYADFYPPVGVYNYYVEKYPEGHPVVRPFMIFFESGDKVVGLHQLEIGSQKGLFTKVEALYYLLHIYIKHEGQAQKALACTQQLVSRYPANVIFVMRHAELLLANGYYDEAIPYIKQVAANSSVIFQCSGAVFNGIIYEKHKRNMAQAKAWYLQAVSMKAINKRYNNDYVGMAYAGLARIADAENKHDMAREYYKKCLDVAEYESTVAEAKAYLKKR